MNQHWKANHKSGKVSYTNDAGSISISIDSFPPKVIRELATKGLRTLLSDRLILKIPSPSYIRRKGIQTTPEVNEEILQIVKREINSLKLEKGKI